MPGDRPGNRGEPGLRSQQDRDAEGAQPRRLISVKGAGQVAKHHDWLGRGAVDALGDSRPGMHERSAAWHIAREDGLADARIIDERAEARLGDALMLVTGPPDIDGVHWGKARFEIGLEP